MPESKDQIVSSIVKARGELELALYELEKLPAISQSSVFFAAHALNNFLTVAGGTVELLSLSLVDHPDPQVRMRLEGLQQATNLMTHTVSRLMNASTDLDAKLRFEKVDLPVMLKHFCSYYDRIADRKEIRCLSESAVDVPSVWTDRVAIAAVLDNLFSNAVKYSPLGTRIWIQVSADRDGVVCSVRDEGPGLSEEDQAKLFQPGVRLTPEPTGGEPSTGYGLAVAKEFIERLGGTIWCESRLGQGSCFSIRLPRYREEIHHPVVTIPE
ncbi:MAG TPA: HAMP domain-containing sensor histidine kinase [Nitrospiraceae bacterium]|nr:HAMP domain-containing sensor histidine kinase [Nitrospiraceae bacterium]